LLIDWFENQRSRINNHKYNERCIVRITDHIYFYQERGMLDCNTYVIKGEKSLIIDVGLDRNFGTKVTEMEGDGIDPASIELILNTHLHMDHCCANTEAKEKFEGTIMIAPVQKEHYTVTVHEATRFFGLDPIDFQEDGVLESPIELGNLTLEVIPTPGHSLDSVCLYCPEKKFLVSGDLLFDHNTGRSDLPGGNGEQLKQSIEEMADLDIEILLPGHMGIISEGKFVQENFQFVRENVFRWL
jgi:glyoxylase-like metal-dependent hydrolase (beta-lactamase superfamily II)